MSRRDVNRLCPVDDHINAPAHRHLYLVEGMAVLGIVGYAVGTGVRASQHVYRREQGDRLVGVDAVVFLYDSVRRRLFHITLQMRTKRNRFYNI